MTTLKVYNQDGKQTETLDLDKKIFDGNINKNLLYQAVLMYRANTHRGSHNTKTRADVSGGGKKPWRQKGTGRARVGSNRSPIWRHGGVIFGPHPRSYSFNLSGKIKARALQSSLNVRLKENAVVIIEEIDKNIKKTKEFSKILNKLKLNGRCLLVLDSSSLPLLRAARNIQYLSVKMSNGVNALDVLVNKKIIITKKSLSDLSSRLKKSIG